ncbi:MAG: MBL fold metallo-hydrolase [Pirellulaceae bacterium]
MSELAIVTLKIPNPFSEGRNRVYIIPSDPLTMIDSGVATERGYQALQEGLAEHDIAMRDIGRVILTHKHIDHIGNAWRIQQASGAEILIHRSEMDAVSMVDPHGNQFRAVVSERLKQWQVPAQIHSAVELLAFPSWEIRAAQPTAVDAGQRIELSCGELEVHHFPGHTGGSIGIQLGRRLLIGDHVLPDISPNIGGGDMQYRGLLRQYIESLARTIELSSSIDEVLPGHGDPFVDLKQRCQTLFNHHQQRLESTVAISQPQRSPIGLRSGSKSIRPDARVSCRTRLRRSPSPLGVFGGRRACRT